jgi:CMP-N,N'-diacetyllegionaminic acid synthase
MRVLGLIPARGGSKGVPRKNVRLLGGKPLLHYTAEAALAARRLDRVILSTDDEEVAEVGRAAGLEVPFLRPGMLADDAAPMFPTIVHALRQLAAEGASFDALCLLQPTNPFRRAAEIDACVALLEDAPADTVFTVLPVPPEHNPHWVYFSQDGLLKLSTNEAAPIARRQDLPPAFHREGSVYVARCSVILDQGTLYGPRIVGYPLDPARRVNIDTMADWDRAEALLQGGR